MIEIELDEYVRTKEGLIFKIVKEHFRGLITNEKYDCKKYEKYENCKPMYINKLKEYYVYLSRENIKNLKHSKNIIDLIEVGDYVNGYLVDELFYDYANKKYHLVTEGRKHIFEKDIKSIVTKEQFQSVMYEV